MAPLADGGIGGSCDLSLLDPRSPSADSATASRSAATDTIASSQTRVGARRRLRRPATARRAFEKHGAEFGHISKQDYLRQAQLLRDAKVAVRCLKTVRRDGVVTRYDQQTGAFIAFNANGVIRTFFKPNDGERYYRRQAERGE